MSHPDTVPEGTSHFTVPIGSGVSRLILIERDRDYLARMDGARIGTLYALRGGGALAVAVDGMALGRYGATTDALAVLVAHEHPDVFRDDVRPVEGAEEGE